MRRVLLLVVVSSVLVGCEAYGKMTHQVGRLAFPKVFAQHDAAVKKGACASEKNALCDAAAQDVHVQKGK